MLLFPNFDFYFSHPKRNHKTKTQGRRAARIKTTFSYFEFEYNGQTATNSLLKAAGH